ncbi:hypothetical protein [Helicobacter brantae]|uniref:Uncharacterized protein n=1 Tax=Helicobacter brantae TaxID=375927 RepID=A0A3D8J311_9HELI|nr:hypothetical protein [Helicobacter brantae]RDU71151.1 hypothetical protein CQA58_03290 [Helicobacter brantae]
MQSSFIIFFYILSFVLLIPIVLLGILITPEKPSKPSAPKKPTPQDLLKQIKKNKDSAHQALKNFEELFIDAQSCDRQVWMNLLDQFALCKWLETTEVVELQQRVIEANPQLKKEIENHISNSLKNRK